MRIKKQDGPPRLKREETQSVGKRRGVLINKMGGKVIQIELRKAWWDGDWAVPGFLGSSVGLGWGWAAEWAQQLGCTILQMAEWWPNPSQGHWEVYSLAKQWGSSLSSGGAEPQLCP